MSSPALVKMGGFSWCVLCVAAAGRGPGPGLMEHPQRCLASRPFSLISCILCSQVAIKSIRKDKIKDEQDLLHIRREIEIMSSLNHPHIIAIHEGTVVGYLELGARNLGSGRRGGAQTSDLPTQRSSMCPTVMPITTALGGLRQEEEYKFEVSQRCITGPCLEINT